MLSPDWRRALVRAAGQRGDQTRIVEIAGWGAALGDLATEPGAAEAGAIKREAALFNLGVAVFDSLVDEGSPSLPDLAEALAPRHLHRRLHSGGRPDASLACSSPENMPIVRLFDGALSSVAVRRKGAKEELDQLSRLLELMYRSEMGLSSDPFVAKRLPVSFIGYLGAVPGRHEPVLLFHCLGHFLHLLDDWQDLADDLIQRAPNAFLGRDRPDTPEGLVANLGRGLGLAARGPEAHEDVAQALRRPLERSLGLAAELGPGSHDKLVSLLWSLLG
jgi:hypothetical protein